MSRRTTLAAAALAALLTLSAAGCARDGDGGDGGAGPAPAATPSPTPTQSAPPPVTTTAPARPKGKTAEELVVALRQSGLPVLGWTLVTGPTDPDGLLGRPGQYTSKVVFSDRRLVAGGGTEAANLADGGAIEVFATQADAAKRAKALGATARASRHGRVVLALSRRLGAGAAASYREALERAL